MMQRSYDTLFLLLNEKKNIMKNLVVKDAFGMIQLLSDKS